MSKSLKLAFFLVAQFLVVGSAFALDGDVNTAISGVALAAGLAIGIAAFGGGIAQGITASKALEGIARNPGAASKVQTPMIIALALIESLVIYSLVIAFLLQGRLDILVK